MTKQYKYKEIKAHFEDFINDSYKKAVNTLKRKLK